MAKGKKGIDGVDKVVDLFPASSHKKVERLLKRAREKEARQAGRSASRATRELGRLLSGGRGRGRSDLAGELAKALGLRGDGKGKASIRQRAPDTGGRPFHFAHSVVKKEDAPRKASSQAPGGGPSGSPAPGGGGTEGGGKAGRAAAHMRYIEREMAVERTYGQGLDGPGAAHRRSREGVEREAVHATGASAGQAYVENPAKLANGEVIAFSFGTIGDRFEDRLRFWEALEEAESHPSARVQHRLIVELPHEASPAARFEMVRRFCRRFEDDGIPFWAALHAPGPGNDHRNFHAHVVYSERPAKRIKHPADPAGPPKWDFEVTKEWVDSSRHKRVSRPFRQDKLRAYHDISFIKTLRSEFKDVVNDVLARDGVKDAKGAPVAYDARSYRDMGLDVVPMRSINRIVADKVRGGKATVLDDEYTRRMVAAELREAAAKRDKDVLELVALDDALRAATALKAVKGAATLPRDLRPSPLSTTPRATLRPVAERLMRARREALEVDVMERAAVASLERVVEATAPRAVEAATKSRDEKVRAQAPDAEAARILHAAALEELRETRREAAVARRSLRYRVGAVANEWRELTRAPPTTLSATVRRTLAEMDRGPPEATTARARADRAPAGAAPRAKPVRDVGPAAIKAGAPDGPAQGPVTGPQATTAPQGQGPAPARKSPTANASASVHCPMPGMEGLPTHADLQAASRTVSGWIRAIGESVQGAEARMAAVDQFLADMQARRRAAKAAAATAARDGGERGPRSPAAPSVVGSPSGFVDHNRKEPSTKDSSKGAASWPTTTTGTGHAPVVAAGVATSTVGPEKARRGVEAIPSDSGSPAAGAPGERASEFPEQLAVVLPPAEEPDPEARSTADDKRRRKAREDELEARRKKRKAVLGRKNKERSR